MASGMLTNLDDVCRAAGLKVVEVKGWKTRARSSGNSRFGTVSTIVCHHTAGSPHGNMGSLGIITSGRSGLPGPLANLGLGRDGTVYIVAAGPANHAGVVRSTSYGNTRAIGIEAEATGVDVWPQVQMDAYIRLCRALCDAYGIPASHVLGHKEVCFPPGRKSDPNFDMGKFRYNVSHYTSKDWFDMADKQDLAEVVKAQLAPLNARLEAIEHQVSDNTQYTLHYNGDATKKAVGRIEAAVKALAAKVGA